LSIFARLPGGRYSDSLSTEMKAKARGSLAGYKRARLPRPASLKVQNASHFVPLAAATQQPIK